MHTKTLQDQGGAGVLAVHVSTIGAVDEADWARAEHSLCSPSDSFSLHAKFGTDGVEAFAPWATAGVKEDGSDQLRRCSMLYLPYYNLADGAESTDASLTLKITVSDFSSTCKYPLTSPIDDGHDQSRSSQAFGGKISDIQDAQENRATIAPPNESRKLFAVATLDVQTGLRKTFCRGRSVTRTSEGKDLTPFKVFKRGHSALLCQDLPGSISVSVEVLFSKTTFDATAVREKGVARTLPLMGKNDAVPALFVVATTLFDCARAMKDAELRLYTRCGDTGRVSQLSSAARGDIAVHESFEWNVSADLSVLFSTAGQQEGKLSHSRQGGTLIIALVDRATFNYRSGAISRPESWTRSFPQEKDDIVVGVLELSPEQLVWCGVLGRWCPLMALSKSSDRGGGGHGGMNDPYEYTGQNAVGEVLVAFAWMEKGPATDILPRAPTRCSRVAKGQKRLREKQVRGGNARGCQRRMSRKRTTAGDFTTRNAVVIDRPFVERDDTIDRGLAHKGTLVYIHVWDALVPRDRQGSALYLTFRLSSRGARVQRVSTKPARGRGGVGMDTTSADGSIVCSPGASIHKARRRSREGFMHVVWDEHLSLMIKGPVDDGAVVELLLRDASVDDNTTIAAREGEPFQTFAERNRPGSECGTQDLAKSTCSSTSYHNEIPGPAIYRLRFHHPPGDVADGTALSSSPLNAETPVQTGPGLDGVEVRVAGLVLQGHGTVTGHDEDAMKHFRERKADVARIPGGVGRRLSIVGGGGGSTSYVNSTPLPTPENRRLARHSRLLDLSAASGLFHQFADGEQGESRAVTSKDTSRPSPEVATGDAETQPVQDPSKTVPLLRHEPSCSAPSLSQETLRLVVDQCFPRLVPKSDREGVHAGTSPLATDGHLPPATAHARDETRHDLSFADFVRWLRSLPQADLGTAGLLVSPRTALHQTGNVMHKDADLAQELAATLELARQPMTTLVGGWCSISLKSTEDAVALDRLRLGWRRTCREGLEGDEPAEHAWRRHTKMLGRDVAVLGKALTELEGRCARDPSTRTGWTDTNGALENSSKDGHGVAIALDGGTRGEHGGTSPLATKELSQNLKVPKPSPLPENGAAFACVGGLAGQNELGSCSIVAFFVGQEAARLALAAEHLKEALRCAADGLHLETTRTLDDQLASHRIPCARSGVDKRWCGSGNGTGIQNSLIAADRNESDCVDARGSSRRHHYGLLLQHIKRVTSFQAEIWEFQRRASVLARRSGDQRRTLTEGRSGGGRRYDTDDSSTHVAEAPRSALALVKRIRRAQNAARRQASPGYDRAASGIFFASEGKGSVSSGRGFAGPPEATDDCGPLRGNGDASAEWQLPQDSVHSPALCSEGPVKDSGCPERVAVPFPSPANSFPSPRLVFEDMLRQPSSLDQLQKRLESLRVAFLEKGIDLPAKFSRATAEQVLDMARGCGKGRLEASLTKFVPAAALCCPIDRFALHVFRTAGAAAEGGSTVYADVQELACMGGLDTHTSETSLWTTVAKAGIVDVDRWVVAAVLRQATDAIESTSDWGTGRCPHARSDRAQKMATAAAEMAGTLTVLEAAHVREAVLAEAKSLWEELRNEAFLSVLGSSSQSAGRDTMSIAELCPSSSGADGISREEAKQVTRVALAAKATDDEVAYVDDGYDMNEPHWQRYKALSKSPGHFDVALMRTLVLAGQPQHAAVGPVKVETTAMEAVETPSSHLVEDTLLYNFVVAGFADGSRLKLSDIVDAVIVRRQRSALGVSTDRLLGRPSTEKDRSRPGDSQGPTGRPKDHAGHELPFGQETRSVAPSDGEPLTERLIDEGEEAAKKENTAGSVSTGLGVDSRYIVGIPPELHKLFRRAGLAEAARKRHRQRKQEQEGSVENGELEVMELAVKRILDSDRTLESAPFSGGKTALHHAAARGDDFLVRLLLERGCKPDVKDFEGKCACDLTRNLECLRLLGTLKKAVEPSALSLRRTKPDEVAAAGGKTKQCETTALAWRSARALANIEFAVSFRRLDTEETVGPAASTGVASSRSSTEITRRRSPEVDEEGRYAAHTENGEEATVKGVARSYDVRNKVLYIDEVGSSRNLGVTIDAAAGATSSGAGSGGHEVGMGFALNKPAAEKSSKGKRIGDNRCHQRCARHILDVELLACLSPQGEELFKQLQAFSCAFKTDIARSSLDLAVDAAADLGASCRVVLDGLLFDILKGELAVEAYREERFAVAAEGAAVSAVAAVLRAAQRAVIARHGPGRSRANRRSMDSAGTGSIGNITEIGKENLRRRRASGPAVTLDQVHHGPVNSGTGTKRKDYAAVVDKTVAARMRFSCTTIVRERRHKALRNVASDAASGKGRNAAAGMGRKALQYLAKWTVEDGISTVIVSGRSYLDAVASEKKAGGGGEPINLEGGDAGIQRVLDHHGVTLPACVQTFDLMQDMEDPIVVLDMLAAGICQLSTRYPKDGIDFSSLNQSDQDALKADVLGQLRHAMSRGAGAASEWDELAVTMRAYGGLTSVRLVRNGGNHGPGMPQGSGGQDLVVSAPTATGWLSLEEAAAAMATPSPAQDTCSPASCVESLPPSAVELTLALMRCNLCEVLGSLNPGIGTDGRIALIGRINNSGSQPFAAKFSGDRGRSKKGELNSDGSFCCSLEVAWDKEKGGVFVKRFGMEQDERKPKLTLRAVGIQGFSITQLPVTLDDIDEVWDQAGIDETSGSDTSAIRGRSNGSTSSASSSRSTGEGGASCPPPESDQASSAGSNIAQVSTGMSECSSTPVNARASEEDSGLAKAGPTLAGATAEAAEQAERTTIARSANVSPGDKGVVINSSESGKASPATVLAAAVVEGVSASIDVSDDPTSRDGGAKSGNQAGDADIESVVRPQEEEREMSTIAVAGTTKDKPAAVLVNEDGCVVSSQEELPGVAVDPAALVAGQEIHGGEGSGKMTLEESVSKEEHVPKSTLSDSSAVQLGEKRRSLQAEEGPEKEEEGGKGGQRKYDEGEKEEAEVHRNLERGGAETTGNSANEQSQGDDLEIMESRVQTEGKEPRERVVIDNMTERTSVLSLQEESGESKKAKRTEEEPSAGGVRSPPRDENPPASSHPSGFAGLTTAKILSPENKPIELLDPSEPLGVGQRAVESLAGCDRDEDGSDGEFLQQDGMGMSATTTSDALTASGTTGTSSVAGGKSKKDGADTRGSRNGEANADPSRRQRLEKDTILESQEQSQRLKEIKDGAQSQSVLGGSSVGVVTKALEEHDSHGATPVLNAVSGEDDVHEGNVSGTRMNALSPSVWEFPPSFVALVTLSTASDTVDCTLEGEIVLESAEDGDKPQQISARDGNESGKEQPERPPASTDPANRSGLSWQSRRCVYKMPIEEDSNALPAGDIDLEDDDAQARLEDLLVRTYGLTMEDVLEGFSAETDLGSGDAVVKSFTDSICHLRPALLQRSENQKSDGKGDGGGSTDGCGAVYKAVEAALRGDNGIPKWQEVQVRVGEARVLEVSVASASDSTTGKDDHEATKDGGDKKSSEGGQEAGNIPRTKPAAPLSGKAHAFVVECSDVLSPPLLRSHLVEEGVHPSAIVALDRAGFFDAGPGVIDVAGVLAALAQEAMEKNALRNTPTKNVGQPLSSAIESAHGHEGWPGIDPGRRRSQALCALPDVYGGESRTAQKITVAVSGTPEDFVLDVSSVMAKANGSAVAVGGGSVRVSRLRPLNTCLSFSTSSPPQTAPVCKGTDGEEIEGGQNGDRPNSPSDTDRRKNSSDVSARDDIPSKELNIGDRIEARFGGKSEWFPGVVTGVHRAVDRNRSVDNVGSRDGSGSNHDGRGSGTRWPKSKLPYISVDYDDGDAEERVPRVRVRRPGQKQPRFLNKGDEVDVKRGKRIFLARVVACATSYPLNKREGHYDLELLDDGRPGRGGGGGLVENCPRSAIMALHGWPPART